MVQENLHDRNIKHQATDVTQPTCAPRKYPSTSCQSAVVNTQVVVSSSNIEAVSQGPESKAVYSSSRDIMQRLDDVCLRPFLLPLVDDLINFDGWAPACQVLARVVPRHACGGLLKGVEHCCLGHLSQIPDLQQHSLVSEGKNEQVSRVLRLASLCAYASKAIVLQKYA